jgi:Mu transposase, C-terminal domain
VRRKSGRSSESIARRTKTAVDAIFVGKGRAYNRRFQQMCGHYLVDPVACTPASGWEKGQVENQVGVLRRRFFVPRPKFKSYAELNAWLEDRCLDYARANKHPEMRDRTIWEVFEDERPRLVPYVGPFDGFHAVPASVSKICLVRFDNNRYSVDARAVGRPVEIRAYADRLECWQDGLIVGQHERAFGRGKTIFDPLHYIPVLARKPDALRNGAPFKEWNLPIAIRRVQRKLERQPGGDRQMVDILSAVLTDGIDAVEAACAEALVHNVHSAGVVLNILARHREPPPPLTITTPDALRLMPFAPAQARLRREANDDLSLRWLHRDRALSADSWVHAEVPMSEASESYDLEILNAGVVVRTVSHLTTPGFTWTTAMQTADVGGPVTSVDVRIYQIGALGRGVPLATTLTVTESP